MELVIDHTEGVGDAERIERSCEVREVPTLGCGLKGGREAMEYMWLSSVSSSTEFAHALYGIKIRGVGNIDGRVKAEGDR